jgi:hypothetical protein
MMLSAAIMGGIIQKIGYKNSFHLMGLVNFLLIGFFYLFMKNFDSSMAKPVNE